MRDKALLRWKLVAFQRRIHALAREFKEREESFRQGERETLLEFLGLVDIIETLEENLAGRGGPEAAALRERAVGHLRRRLLRMLEARGVAPLNFPDNKARMDSCKVVETRPAEGLADETILAVVRKGYADTRRRAVLRKAEVVTVRN